MNIEVEENMDIQKTPEQQALEEAKLHVEKNTIPAKDGRECVDGRYDQHSLESGFLARPGGDFGYVMGLLGLRNEGKINLTPEECVDAVYDVVSKDGGRFYAHSDDHAKHDGTLSGCGHIMKSATPSLSKNYGVNPSDVQSALNYTHEITRHQELDEVELHGNHEEKGVLIVLGGNKTVDHHDEKNMYFVYDADRDAEFQKNLVEKMNIPRLTVEDFRNILKKQTDATVGLLAAGKPIFEVSYDEKDQSIVKFIGNVPQQASQ